AASRCARSVRRIPPRSSDGAAQPAARITDSGVATSRMETVPIQVSRVDHFFGGGSLRKQILFDVSTEIRAGEIVIVTGPSGSGKTTLLTLIGALRHVQAGSVRILGDELNGASARAVGRVRRSVGYIFQAHNLLTA